MESKPVICVALCEQTLAALTERLERVQSVADAVEIRVDCLNETIDEKCLHALNVLLNKSPIPVIITFRPAEEGGAREVNVDERVRFWSADLAAENNLFDIEYDLLDGAIPRNRLEAIGWSRVICSRHFSTGRPGSLNEVYARMAETPTRVLKIVISAEDAIDCLPIFKLLERARSEGRDIIPIAMGTPGIATRILGPSRGAYLTYASPEDGKETAPGQLSARELRDTYHIDRLTRQTEIFGLIGRPVSHSVSPQIHNAAFEAVGRNAVYIPFEVTDLEAFIRRMVHSTTREIDWNVRGLSVTAPHKSEVMRYLDWIDPAAHDIGAVNTIVIDGKKLRGFNTDATGFIDALRERLDAIKGMHSALIGAGGAAAAAMWALKREGAEVTVFSRTRERAETLAARFDGQASELASANFEEFDVVINATALGTIGELQDQTPVTAAQLRGARLAYDLVYNPTETQFLREARKAKCETLGGARMFLFQAEKQFELWTGSRSPEGVMSLAMQKLDL